MSSVVPDLAAPAVVARHLDSLRADRDRFASMAGVDPDTPVPHCPGWTVQELIDHTGRIHRWARIAIMLPPDAEWPPLGDGPGDQDPIDWLVAGLDDLIAGFGSTDLTAPCFTFAGPGTPAWWLRRQALETAVHRWDAQAAASERPEPVDGGVAHGGIDEWCDLEARRWFTPQPDLSVTVHLHATDPAQPADDVADSEPEWYLEATPDGLTWEHGHRKGDVAVRATRSDLLLTVWNRIDPAGLDVLGDLGRLTRFLEAAAVG